MINGGHPEIDLDHLRRWVGRERRAEDDLSPFPCRALAAALDRNDVLGNGDELPPAWHWLYFLETPRASATGGDGHAARGGFLPPVPLPRRMWASGRFDLLYPLVLGRPATRKSVIRSVETKSGKNGALVFVMLDHELSQQGQLCIREEQSLAFSEMPRRPVQHIAPPAAGTGRLTAHFSRLVLPDPVLLFRYSALTYNGHRIHYDRPYAIEQELYPALVLHGPLLTTLLLELLHNELPRERVLSYRFRALQAALDTARLTLNGRRDGDEVALWTTDPEGQLGMSAEARLA